MQHSLRENREIKLISKKNLKKNERKGFQKKKLIHIECESNIDYRC